ncbi:hypothetical protein Tco_1035748, partial [Tanacetum coccineum]
MTGHRDKLINFVSKFIVRQLYDSDLEVAFRKHTCFVCNLDSVDLLSGSHGSNLHTISLKDMMNLQKEDLVKGSPKLKYTKDHLCSACQMGKSKKESHKPKPEPSIKEKLQMLHIDLCGPMFTWVKILRTKDETLEVIIKFLKQAQPTNDSEYLGKLKPKADIGIFIGYSPSRKAYRIYNKRAQMIMETIHVQMRTASTSAMFDKYFKQSPSVVSIIVFTATLPPPDTVGASSSTFIDQDDPSLRTSPITKKTKTPIHSTNVKYLNNKDLNFDNDTFINPFDPPTLNSAKSSSRIIDTSNMYTFQQLQTYIRRWTKDHPLVTIIDNPSKPVSTRRQLAT